MARIAHANAAYAVASVIITSVATDHGAHTATRPPSSAHFQLAPMRRASR